MNLKLALIGSDVSRSLSAPIHKFILGGMGIECSYEHMSLKADELKDRVKILLEKYDGFNVTVPYKEEVIKYLDELESRAERVGSVNTVKTGKSSKGYSTDGLGFMAMLQSEGVFVKNKKVLLLGAGGAAKSCAEALIKGGADLFVYNRTQKRAEEMLDKIGGFKVLKELKSGDFYAVINATSLGSKNYVGISPAGEEVLSGCSVAVDMNYNPEVTEFLNIAKKSGKKIINGKKMLFFQAYYADCIYLDRQPDNKEADKLCDKFFSEVKL